MKPLNKYIIIICIMGWMPVADAINEHTSAVLPDNVQLEISLHITPEGTGEIKITNHSNTGIGVLAPSDRLALYFLVIDEYGNQVYPTFLGKSDPGHTVIEISSNGSYTYLFDRMIFITVTAGFGYSLEDGKEYRVVAIYRPIGFHGPGYATNEVVFKYK
jgi:hypothetical protein